MIDQNVSPDSSRVAIRFFLIATAMIVLLAAPAEAIWTNAAEPMGANAGVRAASVQWGDYDNDGDLDLAVAGRDGVNNRLIVYRNDGANVFTNVAEPMGANTGVYDGSVQWGDYDNDGDLDLAVAGDDGANRRLIVYRNDGNNVFTNAAELSGVNGWRFIQWGDYDNDGDLDLAAADRGNGFIYNPHLIIFRNDGNNVFTNVADTGVYSNSVQWGDYDNDGDLDLATGDSGLVVGRLIVLRNDGNNIFTNAAELGSDTWQRFTVLHWGDYDSDGDLDMVVSDTHLLGIRLIVYRNDGNNVFTNAAEPMGADTGVWFGSVQWGDYDNDGDLDLAVAGRDGTVADGTPRLLVYRNDGNNVFTNVAEPMGADTGVGYASVQWGDYDNDGDLDLAVAGEDTFGNPRLIIYRNDANGAVNVRPAVPTLTSPADGATFILGDTIPLRWTDSTGDATPTPAMTYNLRVGSSSGGVDVVSADTDSNHSAGATILGNVQNDTTAWLQSAARLPAGTYYWSVQAVDGGQMRSTWAAERSFTVESPAASVNDGLGPEITLVSPDSFTFTAATVTVVGTVTDTNALSDTLLVRLNGVDSPVSLVAGGFQCPLELVIGFNTLILTATDTFGNSSTLEKTLSRSDSIIVPAVGETTVTVPVLSPDTGAITVDVPTADTFSIAIPIYSSHGELYDDTWTIELNTKDTGVNFVAQAIDPDSYNLGTEGLSRWDDLKYTILEFTIITDTGDDISDSEDAFDAIYITFHISTETLTKMRQSELEHLKVFWFNENSRKWVPIGIDRLDVAAGTVRARLTHFSIYAVFVDGTGFDAPAADLGNVVIYPNPYQPNDGDPGTGIPFGAPGDGSGIYINGLVPGTTIEIYDLRGRLLQQMTVPVGTGAVQWDARNESGEDVASGVYFAVFRSGSEQRVEKVFIVR